MRLQLLTFAACLALSALSALSGANAQTAPRQLFLAEDGHIELSKAGGARESLVVPGPGGRVLVAPRNGWDGAITVMDSAGAPLPWKIQTGRNDNAEIMLVNRAGWIAGSNTLWVSDRGYDQVALVDDAGKVTKSIEYASWVHPSWAQRRDFPVFGAMDPLAVYADQTMLVMPGRERSFISTPGFDHTVAHILRTTWSGAIQRTVATLPIDEGKIDLRARNGAGYTMVIPFTARTFWTVSPDGMRITVVTPGVSLADSGTIRVVALNDRGDTVFARRYPSAAVRVKKDAADRFLANIRAVGTISAEKLRDSASKQIPLFESFVAGVMTGVDRSTWVLFRAASDTSKEIHALVLDPRGDVAGIVTLPSGQTAAAVSLDHLWAFEIGRMRTPVGIVRYSVRSTGVPLARIAKPSALPTPSRPER